MQTFFRNIAHLRNIRILGTYRKAAAGDVPRNVAVTVVPRNVGEAIKNGAFRPHPLHVRHVSVFVKVGVIAEG